VDSFDYLPDGTVPYGGTLDGGYPYSAWTSPGREVGDTGWPRARLAGIYMEKGVSPNLAEAVARQISADPERPTCSRRLPALIT
jgi:hypothetical protein